jgi:hypothetical protein
VASLLRRVGRPSLAALFISEKESALIDRASIEKIAIACRRGLNSLYGTRGSTFADFPRGACGPASEIVGRLLKEQLHYDGVYVCGCEHPGLPADQSHAWFEVADVLIDITYDQFDGMAFLAGHSRGIAGGTVNSPALKGVMASACHPAGHATHTTAIKRP